jgi:hypothetical protein
LTIFRGIQALDRDKPNTANSEVVYSLISGNEDRKFSIEATSKKAVLVLRKTLDYDGGERTFNITIKAQVRKFVSFLPQILSFQISHLCLPTVDTSFRGFNAVDGNVYDIMERVA